ncbi:phosphatidate cytidylyltransferase [Alicyclobacillus fodiniaquatilis]|jgi:phosphatidate cytidylyltransferase|uniref:Phosphatidate cytidylyltransferase n=1 Tax=Alicyclobacillus fodiniaquatilis TaxID=1661150 RepID=A0ABW4JFM8_9BACL
MLKQRVITAAVAILVVLGVLLFGNAIAWKWVVWVCTSAGYIEFATMHRLRWYSPLTLYGILLVTLCEWFPHFFYHPFALFLVIAIALSIAVISLNRVDVQTSALQTIGALYIAAGGFALAQLRALPHGWFWIWFLMIAIWMSDTSAYFVGRFVKGPKLLPEISPKKTISGAVGGIVGAAIGAVIFGLIAQPALDWWTCALTGAVISLAGQLGDLIESAYKRSAGVKDSGKMLPGHGGMLDRVDSLLFAAPFALWIVLHGLGTWFR